MKRPQCNMHTPYFDTTAHTVLQCQVFLREQTSFASEINRKWEVRGQCKTTCVSMCVFPFTERVRGETVKSYFLLLASFNFEACAQQKYWTNPIHCSLVTPCGQDWFVQLFFRWINWVESHRERSVTQMVPLSYWLVRQFNYKKSPYCK